MPVRAVRGAPRNCISKQDARKFRQSFLKPRRHLHLRNAELKRKNETLRLNFGGSSFVLPAGTVLQCPGRTLLHDFVRANEMGRRTLCDAYVDATNEYFFERSYTSFMPVYNYFVTGKLHKPTQMCPYDFYYELAYWRLPRKAVAPCCQRWIEAGRDDDVDLGQTYNVSKRPVLCAQTDVICSYFCAPTQNAAAVTQIEDDEYADLPAGDSRRLLNQLFNEPHTSRLALCLTITSIAAILISNGALVLSTVPEFKSIIWTLSAVENICVLWFIFEYGAKLFAAVDRTKFVLEKLNLIDLAAIIPFFIDLLPASVLGSEEGPKGAADQGYEEQFKAVFLVLRFLRVLRVVRIFKLGRYSDGLQLVGRALLVGMPKLNICLMVILVLCMVFSSIMYFVENDAEGTPFTTIPMAFWWCLVTLSCVGYGDVLPVTLGGRIVATLAVVTGVLAIAVPVTVIVEVFTKEQRKEMIIKNKRLTGIHKRRLSVHMDVDDDGVDDDEKPSAVSAKRLTELILEVERKSLANRETINGLASLTGIALAPSTDLQPIYRSRSSVHRLSSVTPQCEPPQH